MIQVAERLKKEQEVRTKEAEERKMLQEKVRQLEAEAKTEKERAAAAPPPVSAVSAHHTSEIRISGGQHHNTHPSGVELQVLLLLCSRKLCQE